MMQEAKKEKRPAFQFYPKDFLTDGKVVMMTPQARGVYIVLLCHDWLEDGLPIDPKVWLRIGLGYNPDPPESAELIAQLSACFMAHPYRDGFVTNPRLMREREKQEKFARERADAGKKGAKSRWINGKQKMAQSWLSHDFANGKTMANDGSSSSSSPSLKTTPLPPVPGADVFERFWNAYPKKAGKKAAARAWKKLNPSKELQFKMAAALKAQKETDQWQRGFIPNPATWLNGQRWEDELLAVGTVNGHEISNGVPDAETTKKILKEIHG